MSRAGAPGREPSGFEPDRHELAAGPAYRFDLDRRDFLRVMGGGVAVALVVPRTAALEAALLPDPAAAGTLDEEVGAWLHMGPEGRVTVFTGKVEVGQNIRTSLTQAVADELRLDPDAVRLVMGDTERTPFDMGTFGSRTTPQMASQLRRAAATLRQILVDRAAGAWGVDAGSLRVEGGRVQAPDGSRTASLGELAAREELAARVRSDAPVTPPEGWTVAGRSLRKVNGRAVVTGRHRFVSDLDSPGMLHGKVLRPPAMGARLEALDGSGAGALEGVVVVHDGDFAGVAAPDPATAERALELLEARWSEPPSQPSHEEIFGYLRERSSPSGGRGGQTRGSVEEGMARAAVRHEATYTAHYIAHVPMEPRAAVARWDDGRLTVWTGTQRPFGVRDELARAFRIAEDRVRVLMPDTGGAFGGKHTGETAVEAARLARAAGAPVKLVWTRQEEFHWAYLRPAGVMEVRGGADADGRLTAWAFHNHNAGTAGLATPYRVDDQEVRYHQVDSPLRQGSYRALAATVNNFARESSMDELAEALEMDPLAFRLRNLPDRHRLADVLRAAAAAFGWDDWRPDPGRGRGIACGMEKGGYVATCVEAAVEPAGPSGRVRVERVITAFECGAVVNPDHLRGQVDGCVIMALGGALFEKIRFSDGRIHNGRLADYRVPRFSDLPVLETVLVDRPDLPSAGAGETPIMAVAPALAGAIREAGGGRRRELPLDPA